MFAFPKVGEMKIQGDPIYRIEMQLHSVDQVPLFSIWLQGKPEYENAIRVIRNFGIECEIA